MKYLIMIGGPTASGKTSLSIALAQHYNCPILSADSRQFYREISIGTAKPTEEELQAADHRFINSLSIHDSYSVGEYERHAIRELNEIYKDHDHAIMVGGSGLYLRAVAEGVDEFPDVPDEVRQQLTDEWKEAGITALQEELQLKDPQYAQNADIDNPHRIIRALAIIRHTGKTFSSYRVGQKANRPFATIQLRTDMDRELLYQRINHRVDLMMEQGLLDEVKSVSTHAHLNSLNTVGYKELFSYLNGDWELTHAVGKIKQHSRNYAKRQSTWFRNQGTWLPVAPSAPQEALTLIEKEKSKYEKI